LRTIFVPERLNEKVGACGHAETTQSAASTRHETPQNKIWHVIDNLNWLLQPTVHGDHITHCGKIISLFFAFWWKL